jgi:hypothetical protein
VDNVGPHLGVRGLDPLLQLVEVAVDDLVTTGRTGGEASLLSRLDVVGDGVRRAARQLSGVAVAPRQIECFEYLHDLLVRLHVSLLGNWVLGHTQHTEEGHPGGGCHRATFRNEAELVAASARFS